MSGPGPIAPALLAWFGQNARALPFRQDPTPYHIWVSEIMLQQTRVAAALEHYRRFMEALPDIPALAACPDEELFKLWEGLGYYSRARNLKKAAQLVCGKYGGQLPASYEELQKLPGVGEYTAGAIASIAFGLSAPAVDGNVLRVFARLYNDGSNIADPATKRLFTRRVMEQQPAASPGPFNEALMELGALVCLPGGAPLCGECPLAEQCLAKAAGTQLELPVKTPPKARRVQLVTVLVVRSNGRCLLQKRPETGLLAGLWQPFLFEEALDEGEALARLKALGLAVNEAAPPRPLKAAKHIFSHVEWRMRGWELEAAGEAPAGCVWATAEEAAGRYALPGAFKAYRPLLTGGR
ncbi:MAG TPA: A/G-specific adenine glycosylase [Candidatus Fournierella pullicola]|uniref:Adenine DNA glycosylase n=1 Tax=Candidatus Allofournierella pullicola TaxID=2838596 RepID=A0A9D1V2B3_9FIRM|nr:A/G-specific adenine glycosylase [Candidatus Fournierella pullicola]